MRESGSIPRTGSARFNVDIIHYAPVCLNTLLHVMEMTWREIHETLGDDGRGRHVARARGIAARAVDRLMWDEQAGMYFDYNFGPGSAGRYEFATTFCPLWAGMASAAQAARVRENLKRFEAPGGLLTSTEVTGNQWDAPFGWAPLQMIAVHGLRRYGFHDDANRIAAKFVALVAKEFDEHGTIVEKYDVRRRESDVAARHQVRLQRKSGRLRLDQRRSARPPGRDAGALTRLPLTVNHANRRRATVPRLT